MKRPAPPCKECEDRRQFCHSDCEKWAEYEALRAQFYEEKKKDNDMRAAEQYLIDQTVKRSQEYRRSRKK